MSRSVSVAIVGGGFGGVGMAAKLIEAGFDDVTVFEKSGDLGGVWQANTYPGARCDIPSHLYCFSFAPNREWSSRFAPQPEILAYLHEVADRFHVRPRVRCGTEVVSAAFDDGTGRWCLRLGDGTEHLADVVVTATGQLSRPAVPAIPGRAAFAGPVFHSATWDHTVDLAGRRVGVVGTGASAIQFVPQVAKVAERVTLFQRHAPYVLPKADYPYSARTRALFRRLPSLVKLSRWLTYWQYEPRSLGFTRFTKLTRPYAARSLRHMRKQVEDPALRAVLTPTEPFGCKRVLLSNDYYPALAAPNVRVVGSPIATADPAGLVTADGETHRLDAIVLGTGFTATEYLAPMRVTGRAGADLADEWRHGAQAYLGTVVPGFPNFFMLYGPNTNLGHSSIIFMLESQFRYVLQAVRHLAATDAGRLEVKRERYTDYNTEVQRRLARTVWSLGCDSWYLTDAGRNTVQWPGSTVEFRRRLRRFDPTDYTA